MQNNRTLISKKNKNGTTPAKQGAGALLPKGFHQPRVELHTYKDKDGKDQVMLMPNHKERRRNRATIQKINNRKSTKGRRLQTIELPNGRTKAIQH